MSEVQYVVRERNIIGERQQAHNGRELMMEQRKIEFHYSAYLS